jgi:SAM-dependent methyltransferase
MHAPRYEVLLARVRELAPAEPRILDIGQAYEVEQLRSVPGAVVDTLGFDDDRFPLREGERHVSFDLGSAEQHDLWPDLSGYDLVVCAEVIEHLPVSPAHVLRLFHAALRPGGWLVLQTPNAARVRNRLQMLAGRNPFEQLREDSRNAGHFREYTVAELLALGREAGFEPGGWLTADYFDTGSAANRLLRRAGPLIPRSLRAGITVWLQKP